MTNPGHDYGPTSREVNNKLKEIDDVVGQLVDNVTIRGLKVDVTAMIFSDHGMTEINPSKIVNLTGN